ncbi:MAG: acetylglutamate kinase [Candidatus Omnitrophica bacterium]|nr:acetylglutamate kinase [Candidatus Omnitrophota bacterium]
MEQYIEKADVLIEALPYIRRFRGKEVLIKFGGSMIGSHEICENILSDIVFMSYVGIRPILVHGGGPAITENLKKEGAVSQFVDGLRVTDKKTVEVVDKTLRDINKMLVRSLNKLGAHSIGLSGKDNGILSVVKHRSSGDVGFVGDVVSVNTSPLKELTEFDSIPVIYPVGVDKDGAIYNVNGDEAAAKIASAMRVQKIMLLTNVKGILRDPSDESSAISSLRSDQVEVLIKSKVISGGMIPKVKACLEALKGGVSKAHIVNGRLKHSLLLEIFTDCGIGTEIVL